MTRYILALDESGSTEITPPFSRRNTFVYGGLIVPYESQEKLKKWMRSELSDAKKKELNIHDGEVKGHTIADLVGSIGNIADFEVALAYVVNILEEFGAIFTGVYLDNALFFNSEPMPGMTMSSKKGKHVIDKNSVFEELAIAYASFLHRQNAKGRIDHDHLSGDYEEKQWHETFNHTQAQTGVIGKHLTTLKFFKSHESELVQVADIVTWLIRKHHEGTVELRNAALEMCHTSERNCLLYNFQP